MSATKALRKRLKTMTTEQKANLLEALRKELALCKNPMIRSSIQQRISMIEVAS